MHYTISCEDTAAHYLRVELIIAGVATAEVELQLPAWRPGRYELAHFAKNIQQFDVFDGQDQSLPFRKITKDRWQVSTGGATEVVVRYAYYARQRDAGGSWLDETQVTINFINCLVYAEGRLNEACQVRLRIPENYRIACGLAEKARVLSAKDYYQLVDSPVLASADLQHEKYQVGRSTFHLWLWGNVRPDWPRIKTDFDRFTRKQMAVMSGSQPPCFPSDDYHFILQFLPIQHYHGVEHHNSTVIVLGPDAEFETWYDDLLGISSHELFHAWNVIRIRPAELMPYDFTRENYFPTGFVAEGVTTYYGDLFLKRSGVWGLETYLTELNRTLKRHFNLHGRAVHSLVESSFDLWLDGYQPGVPDRKVSIYHKGAVVALILDLEIRQQTGHVRSLDDVMRGMWQNFGQPQVGYTLEDYRAAVEGATGHFPPGIAPQNTVQAYFDECITGNAPLENRLNRALNFVGLEWKANESEMTLQLQENYTVAQRENLSKWLDE
ncbi:MAG: M61 family metallopeptidase [Ferruginibacter sp.]|nr:M61 family metallopeptidase [Cytophagales bacterium]